MTITLTKKRRQILDLLKNTHGTLSAKEIRLQLPDIDLATIYRNLDLFVQEKLITKIHLGSDEALFEYQAEPHHHAVCSDCNKVVHFSTTQEDFQKLLQLNNFAIDSVEIIVRGSCTKNHQS